ncbi:MAG: hypothetical protein FD175_1951 [Beijerinckiaceae bacterium]|nr:MAG: hypothetical protein FD175_1951 [Beijerinckiaceae bacterium]
MSITPTTEITELGRRRARRWTTLRAAFILSAGRLAVWCPWCERLHYHGAEERGGKPRITNRVADECRPTSSSLFRETGYDLNVIGEVKDKKRLLPKAPFCTGEPDSKRLHSNISEIAPGIRRQLLKAILGRKFITKGCVTRQLPNDVTLLIGGDGTWWQATSLTRTIAKGTGLPSLAAYLWGVPEPTAAIRILEATMGRHLDGQALDSILDALDAWQARGRPERRTT